MSCTNDCALLGCRKKRRSLVHRAVLDRREYQLRLLLDKFLENVNARDMFGMTPLMLACLMDDECYGYKIARKLLRHGACINAKDKQCRTALHHCCIMGRLRIACMLLAYEHVDLKGYDAFDYTPLMYASMRGDPDLVCAIVDAFKMHAMSVDCDKKDGMTPMMLACRCGNYASAYVLLVKGHAQVTLRDNLHGLTATDWVHYSHRRSQYSVIEAQQRCSIYGKDPHDRARHLSAAQRGHGLPAMYDTFKPFKCDHLRCKPERICLGDVTVVIPEITDLCPPHKNHGSKEATINCKSSLEVLLCELQYVENTKKAKEHCIPPGISVLPHHREQWPVLMRPCTPALRLLDLMPATGMKPDLPQLLKLYVYNDLPVWPPTACRYHPQDAETEQPLTESTTGPAAVTINTGK